MIQNKVSLGVTAVGAHFCDSMGTPLGAISVAALSQRMTAARVPRISERVRQAAREIEQNLRVRRAWR